MDQNVRTQSLRCYSSSIAAYKASRFATAANSGPMSQLGSGSSFPADSGRGMDASRFLSPASTQGGYGRAFAGGRLLQFPHHVVVDVERRLHMENRTIRARAPNSRHRFRRPRAPESLPRPARAGTPGAGGRAAHSL